MESGTLRDNAYFDVCRLCLELCSKIDLISVTELGDVLFKILPDLDLKLTIDPLCCNSCSKFIISSYNFVCRTVANQERITEFIESNNLHCVDLKDMLGAKNSSYMEEAVYSDNSNPYYETTETADVCSITTKQVDTHGVSDNAAVVADTESHDEYLTEQHVIQDDQKYIIPENQIDTDSVLEVTMEEVVHNWFPEGSHKTDIPLKHSRNQVENSKNSTKNTRIKNKNNKVRVEILSDVSLSGEKSPCIKSEIKNYYVQKKEGDEELKKFKCFQCNCLCVNKQELTEHVKRDHVLRKSLEGARYLCKFCDKTFKQKLHLDGHLLNKHSYIKNILSLVSSKVHFCDYCTYKTINNFNLKNHIENKHTDQSISSEATTRYCARCPYSSKNKGNFQTHIRTHFLKPLFSCCYCSSGFAQKINLHAHYLNHHMTDMGDQITEIITSQIYTCQNCEWRTLFKVKYEKHMLNHKLKGGSTQVRKERTKRDNGDEKDMMDYEIVSDEEPIQNQIKYEIVA